MTIYVLKIKAELENIDLLVPKAHNLWKFNVACVGGAEIRRGITITDEDMIELDGSKGAANFIIKWSGSSTQSYANIVQLPKGKGDDGKYRKINSGQFVSILAIECR